MGLPVIGIVPVTAHISAPLSRIKLSVSLLGRFEGGDNLVAEMLQGVELIFSGFSGVVMRLVGLDVDRIRIFFSASFDWLSFIIVHVDSESFDIEEK